MDPRKVRQVESLTALKCALAARRLITRLDVLPMPFLVIPVLHLPGHPVMVHVVLGHATGDTYVWEHGNYFHPTSDPRGAADRLAGYLHKFL